MFPARPGRHAVIVLVLCVLLGASAVARAADSNCPPVVVVLPFDLGDSRTDWAEALFGTPRSFASNLTAAGVPAVAAEPLDGVARPWSTNAQFLLHLGALVPREDSFLAALNLIQLHHQWAGYYARAPSMRPSWWPTSYWARAGFIVESAEAMSSEDRALTQAWLVERTREAVEQHWQRECTWRLISLRGWSGPTTGTAVPPNLPADVSLMPTNALCMHVFGRTEPPSPALVRRAERAKASALAREARIAGNRIAPAPAGQLPPVADGRPAPRPHAPLRVAVVSASGEGGSRLLADRLLLELSHEDGLELLEREETGRLTQEHELFLAGAAGTDDLLGAGRLLLADVLVLLVSQDDYTAVKCVDIRDGTRLRTLLLRKGESNDVAGICRSVCSTTKKLQLDRTARRRVALCGFINRDVDRGFDSLESTFPDLVAAQLDRSPGVVLVERDSLGGVAAERALAGGEDEFYTHGNAIVSGEFFIDRKGGERTIRLNVRLHGAAGGATDPFEVIGSTNEVARISRQAADWVAGATGRLQSETAGASAQEAKHFFDLGSFFRDQNQLKRSAEPFAVAALLDPTNRLYAEALWLARKSVLLSDVGSDYWPPEKLEWYGRFADALWRADANLPRREFPGPDTNLVLQCAREHGGLPEVQKIAMRTSLRMQEQAIREFLAAPTVERAARLKPWGQDLHGLAHGDRLHEQFDRANLRAARLLDQFRPSVRCRGAADEFLIDSEFVARFHGERSNWGEALLAEYERSADSTHRLCALAARLELYRAPGTNSGPGVGRQDEADRLLDRVAQEVRENGSGNAAIWSRLAGNVLNVAEASAQATGRRNPRLDHLLLAISEKDRNAPSAGSLNLCNELLEYWLHTWEPPSWENAMAHQARIRRRQMLPAAAGWWQMETQHIARVRQSCDVRAAALLPRLMVALADLKTDPAAAALLADLQAGRPPAAVQAQSQAQQPPPIPPPAPANAPPPQPELIAHKLPLPGPERLIIGRMFANTLQPMPGHPAKFCLVGCSPFDGKRTVSLRMLQYDLEAKRWQTGPPLDCPVFEGLQEDGAAASLESGMFTREGMPGAPFGAIIRFVKDDPTHVTATPVDEPLFHGDLFISAGTSTLWACGSQGGLIGYDSSGTGREITEEEGVPVPNVRSLSIAGTSVFTGVPAGVGVWNVEARTWHQLFGSRMPAGANPLNGGKAYNVLGLSCDAPRNRLLVAVDGERGGLWAFNTKTEACECLLPIRGLGHPMRRAGEWLYVSGPSVLCAYNIEHPDDSRVFVEKIWGDTQHAALTNAVRSQTCGPAATGETGIAAHWNDDFYYTRGGQLLVWRKTGGVQSIRLKLAEPPTGESPYLDSPGAMEALILRGNRLVAIRQGALYVLSRPE